MVTGKATIQYAKLEEVIALFLVERHQVRQPSLSMALESEMLSMLCAADGKGYPLSDEARAVFEDWASRIGLLGADQVIERAERNAIAARWKPDELALIMFIEFEGGTPVPFATETDAVEYLTEYDPDELDAVIVTIRDWTGRLESTRYAANEWLEVKVR